MTKLTLNKFNKMIEYTSIALGISLGAMYLDPMTINSTKNDVRSSVETISYHDVNLSFKNIDPSIDYQTTSSTQSSANIILASSN